MHEQYTKRWVYDTGVVMAIYNVLEYSDLRSKTSGSLWQYYGDGNGKTIITVLLIFLPMTLIVIRSILTENNRKNK